MQASELILRLVNTIAEYGDLEVGAYKDDDAYAYVPTNDSIYVDEGWGHEPRIIIGFAE